MKRNDIFALSSGCYSDYGLNGFFRALKDFNIEEEAKRFLSGWSGERTSQRTHEWRYNAEGKREFVRLEFPVEYTYQAKADVSDFAAFLTREGFVENAEEIREYHCGDYDFQIPQEY